MRWASWLLGIAGVVQYALIAYLQPEDYVSTDMAYLVMWLAVGGGLLLCAITCYGGGCCCDDDGCGCCGDGCGCGDCGACVPNGNGHAHGPEGHEGHVH